MSRELRDAPVDALMDALARPDPVPGGGTASALAGAMAAALVAMVAGLSTDPKRFEAVAGRMRAIEEAALAAKDRLLGLADADAGAFATVMDAYRLPRATDAEKAARAQAIQAALAGATAPPLEVCREMVPLAAQAAEVWRHGNPRARSDVATAYHLARAGFLGARENVEVNLAAIKDAAFDERVRGEVSGLEAGWPPPPAG